MDPRRLLTFRAVAHESSFSAAARTLALTQPAVSQQVAALERELGAKLLNREPGGVTPTHAGAVLLQHADAVADRLELAGTQLAEIARDQRLRVRLGAFPSALAVMVPKAVARLQAERPEAEAIVEEGGTEGLAERVRAGRLHVAVGFQDATQPRREHHGLERVDLLREPFEVALWPGHPLAELDAVPIAALAGEPWVAPSGSNIIARSCREAGFSPRLVMISRDPLANRALIAQGLPATPFPQVLTSAVTRPQLPA